MHASILPIKPDVIASVLEIDWLNDWLFFCAQSKSLKIKNKNKMRLKLEIEMLAYDWLDSILLPPSTDSFFYVDNGFKSRKVFMRFDWTSTHR